MNLERRKAQWLRFGIWRGFYGLVLDALEKAVDLHVLLVNRSPHRAAFTAPADLASTFEFRALPPDEVRRFARDPSLQMPPDFVESSLARGDYCFGVLQKGRLAAYDWRGLRQPVPLNADLDVHYAYPGQVYGYAMYTRAEYRGLRLQFYNLCNAEPLLRAEGHTHTIGYVALQNFASIRNLSRIPGQEFIGVVGYLRLGKRYVTFQTPGAKRYGFRIARSNYKGMPSGVACRCDALKPSPPPP